MKIKLNIMFKYNTNENNGYNLIFRQCDVQYICYANPLYDVFSKITNDKVDTT